MQHPLDRSRVLWLLLLGVFVSRCGPPSTMMDATNESSASDVMADRAADSTVGNDSNVDVASTETGADSGADAAADVLDARSETGMDVVPEAAPEPGPEPVGPEPTPMMEAGPEASPDVVPDVAPDVVTDVVPDVVPEAAVESGVDAAPEASPDSGADVAMDVAMDADPDVATDVVASDASEAGADADPDAASNDASEASVDAADAMTTDAAPPGPVVWVVRVGDGMAAPTSASTAVFIERRRVSDGSSAGPDIALPTTETGMQRAFSLSGTASSEGALTRSVNQRFVTLVGYATGPGTASISGTSGATVPRVVARIDAMGAIDTSSAMAANAFSGNNPRGSASVDGNTFWVAGAASGAGSLGGVLFGALGGGAFTQVVSTPSNVRRVGIIGDQLYGASSSGGFFGVFSVGTGRPTSSATATMLPGMPTATGPSSFDFFGVRRAAGTGSIDTIYVADDRNFPNGGVQRWVADSTGQWTLQTTFNGSLTGGVRGLTGFVTGTTVTLVATTSEMIPRLVVFEDTGTMTANARELALPPTNTAYRGVALAPVP